MKPVAIVEDYEKSISIDGIIDVSFEGKVFEMTVMQGEVLRGQVLMGHGSLVKTAKSNIPESDFRGVALNYAKVHNTVYCLVRGIARLVLHPDAEPQSKSKIIVGDNISSAGDGYACRSWEFETHRVIGKVESVGAGFIDIQIDC